MNDNTDEIWHLAQSGNHDAWKTLVCKYTPLMMAVARKYGLSQAQVDDCVQQTWVSLYQRRDSIQSPEKLKSWLTSVVQRQVLRLFRQTDRLNRRYAQLGPAPEPNLPDEELLRIERSVILSQGLRVLGLQCRRVLHALFYSDADLSYRDIARKLGMPVNSLGPIRNRCLKRLANVLKKLGF